MGKTLLRALIFGASVVAVTLAIDLVAIAWQGGLGDGRGRQFLAFRGALHGATFVMAAAGALAGFAFLHAHAIADGWIAMLGAAFGVFAIAAVLGAVHRGAFAVAAALLPVAAGLLAYFGGKVLATTEKAE